MLGGVVEDHFMGRITQKGGSTGHQGQNAIFALLAQVLLDARDLGHEADQGLGLMDIEVVTDNVPAGDQRIGGDDRLHMGQEILLRTRRAAKRGQQLSRDYIPGQNEATGSMTLVLEFASLHMTWCQRETGMFAF